MTKVLTYSNLIYLLQPTADVWYCNCKTDPSVFCNTLQVVGSAVPDNTTAYMHLRNQSHLPRRDVVAKIVTLPEAGSLYYLVVLSTILFRSSYA